ncbi:hypothetical protein RCC89_10480 [Cytophagaceae bacterium ABcell3]|nr:hypothetical protein RCC89_10480 [Cytophagaceae bacterium ABcell3]
MSKYTCILLFFLTTMAFYSCSKSPNYPNEPFIRFEKLEQFTLGSSDSLVIHLYFEDGDGDLGEDRETNAEPNFFVDLYRFQNGEFVLYELELPLNGTFPPMVDKSYRGPIDGILKKGLPLIPHSRHPGRYRMDIRIRDRAMNYSNTVTSPEFVIGQENNDDFPL